jgi:single-stranded DNA-binding protein
LRFAPGIKGHHSYKRDPISDKGPCRLAQAHITSEVKVEVNQYVTKGMKVAVTGKLIATDKGDCRVWTAQDGTSRASFEVNAREVEFLGGSAHAEGGEAADEDQPATQGEGLADGEIPF